MPEAKTIKYVNDKRFDAQLFDGHLRESFAGGRFADHGPAVRRLEARARELLQIGDDFEVIAVNNGGSALHAVVHAVNRVRGRDCTVATQAFTFPCNAQGPCRRPLIVDLDGGFNLDVDDAAMAATSDIVVVTNVFGHLQDLDKVAGRLTALGKFVIFDNAATPCSYKGGVNSCCLADAACVSLHHANALGFGEGGLAIVKGVLAEEIRAVINFGLDADGNYSERGSNFRMSDIAAAAILTYWDMIDLDEMKERHLENYYHLVDLLSQRFEGKALPNHSDDFDFLPSCLPFIFKEPVSGFDSRSLESKKYYRPLLPLERSVELYDRIMCFPVHTRTDELGIGAHRAAKVPRRGRVLPAFAEAIQEGAAHSSRTRL